MEARIYASKENTFLIFSKAQSMPQKVEIAIVFIAEFFEIEQEKCIVAKQKRILLIHLEMRIRVLVSFFSFLAFPFFLA
jgi:hypothetical protein